MKTRTIAGIATLALASAAQAAERLVPEQYATIEAAVNASYPNDVVSLAPGTYQIGSVGLPSHTLLITGRGTREQTVVTGAGFVIGTGNGARTIAHLTMRGCTAYGAVEVRAASASIVDVSFENCNQGVFATSPTGGSVPASFVQTTDCRFKSNVRGGYAYINSSWAALRCQFIENANPGGTGGAASVERVIGTSVASFTDCVFIRNSASRGGAVGMRFGGESYFNRCYFEGNSATDSGAVSWFEFGGSVGMENGTFCGHSAADLAVSWGNGGGNQFYPGGCPDCNGDGYVDKGQILMGQLADANSNGVADICDLPTCQDADLFRDGQINGADLGALLTQWGPANANTVSDINHDGMVGGADLGLLLTFWGACTN